MFSKVAEQLLDFFLEVKEGNMEQINEYLCLSL